MQFWLLQLVILVIVVVVVSTAVAPPPSIFRVRQIRPLPEALFVHFGSQPCRGQSLFQPRSCTLALLEVRSSMRRYFLLGSKNGAGAFLSVPFLHGEVVEEVPDLCQYFLLITPPS